MLNQIGRICVKIAGRDAGKKCVIVDVLENNLVLIDGQTRRRKCNIMHLEPLNEMIELDKGASHEEVVKEFKKLGVEVKETKKKASADKPAKTRDVKAAQKTEAKKEKKKPSKDNTKKKKTK